MSWFISGQPPRSTFSLFLHVTSLELRAKGLAPLRPLAWQLLAALLSYFACDRMEEACIRKQGEGPLCTGVLPPQNPGLKRASALGQT